MNLKKITSGALALAMAALPPKKNLLNPLPPLQLRPPLPLQLKPPPMTQIVLQV